MDRDEAVCRTILSIAITHRKTKDQTVASTAIGALLREHGKSLAKSQRLISYGAYTSSDRRVDEHAIPVNYLVKKILSLPRVELTVTSGNSATLQVMLQDHIRIVCITADEHDRLKGPLKAGMPSGWQYDDDWLARYNKVGIVVLEEVPGGLPVPYRS